MITPRIRPLVSVAATCLTLALAACATGNSHLGSNEPAPAEELSPTIRFDNDARDYVHVYLVGVQREWLLGRVAPGAKATLTIPASALDGPPLSMHLAVLIGEHPTLRVAGDPRAITTIAEPAGSILSQRFTFSQPLTGQAQVNVIPLGAKQPRH